MAAFPTFLSRSRFLLTVTNGALFAGIGALLAPPAPVLDLPVRWVLAAGFGVLGVVVVLTAVLAWLRDRRADRLLRTGVVGQATITSIKPASTKPTGAHPNEQPVFTLQLSVQMPGSGAADTATVQQVIPLVLLAQVQPGLVVPVRVDAKDRRRLAIDWAGRTGRASSPPAMAATTLGELPGLPALPLTGAEPPDVITAAVRAQGAQGRAILTSVVPDGTQDGKTLFLIGLTVQMDSGACTTIAGRPDLVDPAHAAKVVAGRIVPLSAALIGPVTVTVLHWDAG